MPNIQARFMDCLPLFANAPYGSLTTISQIGSDASHERIERIIRMELSRQRYKQNYLSVINSVDKFHHRFFIRGVSLCLDEWGVLVAAGLITGL